MKKTLKLIFLLIPIFCFSNINIKGKIVDENNVPVPYVNIYIKNTSIGTISNTDGFFKLQISENYINSSLLISSIGFKTKEIQIKELNNGNISIIKLEVNIVLLDEVVLGKKYTANQIVQKAFANYYKNFPTEPFIAKGFLRHTEKTKKEYKWMVEAAIEVYDPGFDKKSKKIKTNIKEIRKSLDNRNLDTLDIHSFYLSEIKGLSIKRAWRKRPKLSEVPKSEIKDAIAFHDDRKSNPSFLFSVLLRRYKQKNAVFDKRLLKKHLFKTDTILSYGEYEVYKIKITPTSPPSKLTKMLGRGSLPFGWMYIRTTDFAIVAIEYTLINSEKNKIFTEISGSKIHLNFTIKFIEINGKMYPKHIIHKSPKLNRFHLIIEDLARKKKTNSEDHYFSTQEVIFTEIITDTKVINQRLKEPWDDNLFKPRPYNATFWNNYNIFPETKEQQKMIQDLEKKVNLKEQFLRKK